MPREGLTFPVPGRASVLQGGKAASRDAATGEQTGHSACCRPAAPLRAHYPVTSEAYLSAQSIRIN